MQSMWCVYSGGMHGNLTKNVEGQHGDYLLQTRVGSMLVQNAELNSLALWRIRNHVADLSVPLIRHEL